MTKVSERPRRSCCRTNTDVILIEAESTNTTEGAKMGLTINWEWQGPKSKDEALAVIEKMRQRALDLPFESVSEIVHFVEDDARFDRGSQDDEFQWLKIQARQMIWNKDNNSGSQCMPTEILGFQILVAPGSEPMEVILATYPRTIEITDGTTGKRKRLRTGLQNWSGRGFCKTQYASDPQCGGVPNFLRAHLSVCRMLDHAKEFGMAVEVSDEGEFFDKRDVPALVKSIGEWNQLIAGFVGALTDAVGRNVEAPIRSFPNFEHLEAKGQNQIDAFLRILKDEK
jgi:hypothetical protein